MNGDYENTRRVVYETGDSDAVFVPVHEGCGLFVKADDEITVWVDRGLKEQPNATCKKHGRVQMIFEGFF